MMVKLKDQDMRKWVDKTRNFDGIAGTILAGREFEIGFMRGDSEFPTKGNFGGDSTEN